MSMLTPPGMGGKYRVTGNHYPRMRRPRNRRRIALVVAGAVSAAGLAGWGTVQLIDVFTKGRGTAKAAGRADCEPGPRTGPSPSARPLPEPGRITVNVYNATQRSGLAKRIADELKKRGFRIGEVGNAAPEYDKKVKGPGLLLGGPNAEGERLRVLGTQVAGFSAKADTRKGGDVDLIIGDRFKDLTAQEDARRALASLSSAPSPSASPGTKC